MIVPPASNALISAMASHRGAWGFWTTVPDPAVATVLASAGADFVAIDLQHGFASDSHLGALVTYLRVTTAATVVRVPWNRPEYIMRAADLGADAVIVPMVDTADDAAAAVSAARYPTTAGGKRSWGPMWGDIAGIAPGPTEADGALACVPMIETRAAVDNLEGILATSGVAGVYIGPNDLALSCGLGRQTYRDSREVERVIQHVVDTAARAGVPVGLHCADAAMAHYWRERGVSMLTVATDTTLLAKAAARELQDARARV